jgi:TetR/AcrR family transcriptional regulator, repressor for neighboring sulfatase
MAPTRKPPARRRARARTPRRRRAPELARQEILDAAERVFAEFQPDQVGLKEVAREAGVSHALITHYFGTYAGLLEAALERRLGVLRETLLTQLREAGALSRPGEFLERVFIALRDPVHLRLLRWLLTSERPAAANAFGLQHRSLAVFADSVARALAPQPSGELTRQIEIALLIAVSATYGYAIGKHALVGGLGRQPSHELDDQVRQTIALMVQTHIRATLRRLG